MKKDNLIGFYVDEALKNLKSLGETVKDIKYTRPIKGQTYSNPRVVRIDTGPQGELTLWVASFPELSD